MTPAERLLRDGIPPSLLIDLLDPDGMRVALAAEVLESETASDVRQAPAPARHERLVRPA